ncbi:MAG TPA: hypothetical protein DD422_06845 [Akkermansia sp.]|nr:hypothetical protein [Akkermansia sp.]
MGARRLQNRPQGKHGKTKAAAPPQELKRQTPQTEKRPAMLQNLKKRTRPHPEYHAFVRDALRLAADFTC